MLFLERIDGVPLSGNDQLTFEIQRWMITLVDTLNTVIERLETLVSDVQTIPGDVINYAGETNTKYIPLNDSSRTIITLPKRAYLGAMVDIVGLGAAGWSLNPNTGQTIQ